MELATASAGAGLRVSAMAITAGGATVDGDEDRRLAVGRERVRRPRRGPPRRRPAARGSPSPDQDARPSTVAADPPPGDASKSTAPAREAACPRRADDRLAQRVLRAALGGGHQAQQLVLGERRRRPTSVTRGLPSVRVPVLSSTTASTELGRSSASALRNRTPFSAPLPVPTMIEVGVASPSAQGQAMISTATRVEQRQVERGLRPEANQTTKVSAASPSTAGTK